MNTNAMVLGFLFCGRFLQVSQYHFVGAYGGRKHFETW